MPLRLQRGLRTKHRTHGLGQHYLLNTEPWVFCLPAWQSLPARKLRGNGSTGQPVAVVWRCVQLRSGRRATGLRVAAVNRLFKRRWGILGSASDGSTPSGLVDGSFSRLKGKRARRCSYSFWLCRHCTMLCSSMVTRSGWSICKVHRSLSCGNSGSRSADDVRTGFVVAIVVVSAMI